MDKSICAPSSDCPITLDIRPCSAWQLFRDFNRLATNETVCNNIAASKGNEDSNISEQDVSPTSPTTSTVSKRDTERNLVAFQAFMQAAWADLTDKQRDIWNALSVSESTNDLLWDLNDPHMTVYVLPLQFQTQHLLTVIHRN